MTIEAKFCKKCQCVSERNVLGQCKPCVRARSAEWRAKNQDKKKAYQKQWMQSQASVYSAEHASAYYEKNKANLALKKAKYKKENPEKVKLASQKWRNANMELARERRRACQKKNPEPAKLAAHKRRAIKLNAGGELSKGIGAKLFALQRGKCACCGEPLGNKYHLDHIMPLALGGSNTDDNIQLLRPRCNNQKHAKHPIDFMQSRGLLL